MKKKLGEQAKKNLTFQFESLLHGSIFAAEGSIESLLQDFVHNVNIAAVPKPRTFESFQGFLLHFFRHFNTFGTSFPVANGLTFHHIALSDGHVLDTLDRINLDLG